MISLLIIFNNKEPHKKFFQSLEEQIKKQKKIEFIFIVNNKQNLINKIQEFQSKYIDTNFKIISSSKTLSFNQQLVLAMRLITKKYFMVLESTSVFNGDVLIELGKVTQSHDVDIIETQIEFRGRIKWQPSKRMNIKPSSILKISEWNGIVAYMLPFIQNKIFSTKLMKKVLNDFSLNIISDSSNLFSIEVLYLFMLKANTYVYLENVSQILDINENNIINYKNLFKEWDKVIATYFQKQKYLSEIRYAYLYHIQLIVPGIYASENLLDFFITKDNVLLNNYYKKIEKIRQDKKFLNFEITNNYMLYANNETNLLKEITPISKWKKIFSLL